MKLIHLNIYVYIEFEYVCQCPIHILHLDTRINKAQRIPCMYRTQDIIAGWKAF